MTLGLKPEKKERIINASINEFAKKGYDNASTNEIVKEADISKGLLFHYFKNKKQLYLFLYDYCINIYKNEVFNKINYNEKDIFARIKHILIIKWELINKYPLMLKFLESVYLENSNCVKNDLQEKNKELFLNTTTNIFENIDLSKFKEEIDISKAMNIVIWTFEGFSNTVQNKIMKSKEIDYSKIFSEIDEYLSVLKKCFYKEE